MTDDLSILKNEAVEVLKGLIKLPSFSREEDETATFLSNYLSQKNSSFDRIANNIIAKNKYFDSTKPSLLLCSHHDTVKPNSGYTKDPFTPMVEEGRLYGLGSNDAGGCLVALLQAFLHFYEAKDLKYNLVFAAVGEEEISGLNGITKVVKPLPLLDCAIIGEPTGMELAVAEKGLMVLDAVAFGKAGHAAREEGENALYKALKDVDWIRNHSFPKISSFLGQVKMTVTSIETENKAHNIVPDSCRFVVDVRVNECYTLEEVLEEIRASTTSEFTPRSLRLRSSLIEVNHPLVQAGQHLGKKTYGSPTTSDKALLPCPTLKMGPGDSARSHTANEYIYLSEIEEGIKDYIQLLQKVLH